MSVSVADRIRSDVVGGEVFTRGHYVWCIERGRIRRAELTGVTLRLPVADTGHHDDYVEAVCYGTEDRHFRRWTLPVILDLSTIMVPWARWWISPSFVGCEGLSGSGWGGSAHRNQDCILLRNYADPRWTVATALHEIFHVVEKHLTKRELAAVDAAVKLGTGWPDPEAKPGYMSESMLERRARAFEAWAVHRLEARSHQRPGRLGRLRDAIGRWGMPPHEKVFLDVFEGRVARRAVRLRQVARERLPERTASQGDADRAALEGAPLLTRAAKEVREVFFPA